MANSYTTQVLENGPRNLIVKLTAVLDSNDQPMTTMVSPQDCASFVPKRFRIDNVEYTISDQLLLQMYWGGTPDSLVLALAGRGKIKVSDAGGIQNDAYLPSGTIRCLTTGYMTGIQVYSLVLDLVKIGV